MLKEADYAKFVQSLIKPGEAIVASMTPANAELLHMAVGISGESGELLDAIKKYVIYEKEIDIVNIVEELGDIEFFLQGLRTNLGLTRDETIHNNMDKLMQRYPQAKYTNEDAHSRADKQ